MGLAIHDLRLILEAVQRGADVSRVLTLGRLWSMVTRDEVRRLGLVTPRNYAPMQFFDASPLPALLGMREVVAVDASAYEGATWVHDFNTAVPLDRHGTFDLVIDGGTLEHVFNVPIAYANCMRLLRVGGRFIGGNPANNLMGHGFYQFSPDFYYRVFSPENGFRIEVLELQESRYPEVQYGFLPRRYAVSDPAVVRQRVELQSPNAAVLRVAAVKIADVVPFARWPQQSDYDATWHGNALSAHEGLRAWALRTLPSWLTGHLIGWRHRRRARVGNRHHFTPR